MPYSDLQAVFVAFMFFSGMFSPMFNVLLDIFFQSETSHPYHRIT